MYRNTDSQTVLGKGVVSADNKINTGSTTTTGMCFGETTGKRSVKFLGVEDFWGNLSQFIDGVKISINGSIVVGTKNFNDNATGYESSGSTLQVADPGYLSDVIGTNMTGFMPAAIDGSATTYFCDHVNGNADTFIIAGGQYDSSTKAGAFYTRMDSSSTAAGDGGVGVRLMYL